MKIHTTNYFNTLIEIAEDSVVDSGTTPPIKGDKKSIANIQFEMISKYPYQYTSDEVIFECFAIKNDLTKEEMKESLTQFFSKGQPCLRTSPLAKRYGWGIHSDEKGKIALYGAETIEYKRMIESNTIKLVKAIRSKRA